MKPTPRHIVITVDGDGPPEVDLTGFTDWEAAQILFAAQQSVEAVLEPAVVIRGAVTDVQD